MSADLDNQPYDNVEFPVRKPGSPGISPGTWSNPGLTSAQRGALITGGAKEKTAYTLAPVAEGGCIEEEEEEGEIKVEDPRQKMGTVQHGTHQNTNTTSSAATGPPKAPRSNHVMSGGSTMAPLQTNGADKRGDTMRNMKPPPSPSRDSKASFVVTDQPRVEDFTWSSFNPVSQEVFDNAYTRHKYFYKFSDKVLKQGNKMKPMVWEGPGKPGETMTYEQLLQGVLIEGERLLLGGSWLYFRDVEFYEPECSKQIKPPLGEGRICLTNLRMLLLCAEMSSEAKIAEYDTSQKKKKKKSNSTGYKLTVSRLNNVFFQNIPIDCFESVELTSTVGTMAESKLTEKLPMCCGLFSCVGVGRCGYTWDATPPHPVNVVKRVIRLGVYMPPWRTPAVMIVNLHPKMSLTAARDFVSHLQNHVPQMQYHIKHGATVL